MKKGQPIFKPEYHADTLETDSRLDALDILDDAVKRVKKDRSFSFLTVCTSIDKLYNAALYVEFNPKK